MSKCYHTGLPSNMCGHCSHTSAIERAPFNKYMVHVDEPEPRLRKTSGHNPKTKGQEWIGRGVSLGGRAVGSFIREAASLDVKGRAINSVWARENAARTLRDLGVSPAFVVVVGLSEPKPAFATSGEAVKRKTSLAVPTRQDSHRIPHASLRKQTAARWGTLSRRA